MDKKLFTVICSKNLKEIALKMFFNTFPGQFLPTITLFLPFQWKTSISVIFEFYKKFRKTDFKRLLTQFKHFSSYIPHFQGLSITKNFKFKLFQNWELEGVEGALIAFAFEGEGEGKGDPKSKCKTLFPKKWKTYKGKQAQLLDKYSSFEEYLFYLGLL